VHIDTIFSQEMFDKLEGRMKEVEWSSVRNFWNNDLRHRRIISDFMKDPMIRSKRLVSMLDRVTNSVYVDDSREPKCRPTVINTYDGDLSNLDVWFDAWQSFMFDKDLQIPFTNSKKIPYQMLLPIKKEKYPSITEEEENASLPLQTLYCAVYDAILVHMMNTVSEPDVWQPLKHAIVESLNNQKMPRTILILEQKYISNDIIFLQEVSNEFIELATASKLGGKFHVISSHDVDSARNRNSVILLNKGTFPDETNVSEISSIIKSNYLKHQNVHDGDLLVITSKDKFDMPFVIASFRSDTNNGLDTIPVLNAIVRTMSSDSILKNHNLLFGLDANTYGNAKHNGQQDVLQFGKAYVNHSLTSCWGDTPNPKNYTTFTSRTYLQPKLDRACRSNEKISCSDANLKDFILFPKDKFSVTKTWKDNTGDNVFEPGIVFPTLDFPSDHVILSTIIQMKNI